MWKLASDSVKLTSSVLFWNLEHLHPKDSCTFYPEVIYQWADLLQPLSLWNREGEGEVICILEDFVLSDSTWTPHTQYEPSLATDYQPEQMAEGRQVCFRMDHTIETKLISSPACWHGQNSLIFLWSVRLDSFLGKTEERKKQNQRKRWQYTSISFACGCFNI